MTTRTHHAYHFPVLVERLWRERGLDPEQHPDPWQAPIHFRVSASLGFAPGEIVAYRQQPTPDVEVAFLGLQGSQSPLPGYYLDDLAWRQLQQQSQLGEFLDLFHQRWLTLLHRIWRKYRYELRARAGSTDCLSRCLLALSGPPPQGIPPEQWLSGVSSLTVAGQSAATLCSIIRYCFGYPQVTLHGWQRRRVTLSPEQQNRLGLSQTTLGENLLLGACVADCAGKFRLRLQQLTFEQFLQLLPSGRDLTRLRPLIAQRLHQGLVWDLLLELAPGEAPLWHLGVSPQARLGQSCFLGQTPDIPSLAFSVEE